MYTALNIAAIQSNTDNMRILETSCTPHMQYTINQKNTLFNTGDFTTSFDQKLVYLTLYHISALFRKKTFAAHKIKYRRKRCYYMQCY